MKIIIIITAFLLIIHINGYGQIKQKLSLDDEFCYEKTNLDGETYTSIKSEKLNNISAKELPQLPVKIIKLVVPADATDFWIETNHVKTEEYSCEYPILPGSESDPSDSVVRKTIMYPIVDSVTKQELVYPKNIIDLGGVGKLREFSIATVSIYPFQYYPVQKKLIFYKDIDFTLHYKLNESEFATKTFKDKGEAIETMVKKYVNNADDLKKFYKKSDHKNADANNNLKSVNTGITVSCDYVIVTSTAYVPVLNEFMAWKKRKGIDIKIITIDEITNNYSGDLVSGISDDAGKLRQFLLDTYNNSDCFRYALFVGDNEIPIRYLQQSSTATSEYIYPSDYYFADFDTNWDSNNNGYYGESDEYDYEDYEPEIFVGRLMVKTADEIKNWTRKAVLYESDPGKGNPSYLTKAYLTKADAIDDTEFVTDELTWCSTIKVDEELGGPFTSYTPTFPTGSDVINEFNNHYGIASFFAHGRPDAVAVATKGNNSDESQSKYEVTSLDSYVPNGFMIPEDGNGFDNMTNTDYPTVFLSVSCKTMPFDDYGHSSSIRNMGEGYTAISKGGGPIYIGNTRDGSGYINAMTIGEFLRLARDTTFCNIGKLSAFAKVFIVDYGRSILDCYVNKAYMVNLLGCPETELWTATPTTFSSASVSQNGTNVTVSTGGVSGCNICLMSACDNGVSYFNLQPNVSSYTFSNVTMPYYATITKHNKIPYLKNLTTVLFENKTFSSNAYISCQTLSAGYSVDPNHAPDGNVVIASGASVTFDATGTILLDHGFEVQLGATFEAK